MKLRSILAPMLALVVGLAILTNPARGQTGNILLTSDVVIGVPATDQQILRVTFGNPHRPDPAVEGRLQVLSLTTLGVDPVTIGPGESFTYTLDPREVGVLVDANTGLRHVQVSGRVTGIAVDPSDRGGPHPAILIELVNRKTGKLESFHVFPGFAGGVVVAAVDEH